MLKLHERAEQLYKDLWQGELHRQADIAIIKQALREAIEAAAQVAEQYTAYTDDAEIGSEIAEEIRDLAK
jgi:hypothetical protein